MGRVFTEKERAAWAPPERLTPTQWADANRYLPSSVAAEPGRYRSSRTPYIAGIIDAVTEDVEEIVILKAAQLGFTTALQSLIGWAIDQEPAPALLVMPSQDEARKVVEENLKPLIEFTPSIKAHLTGEKWDITKEALRFDSMPLYLGWAGSPQSLARRACRYIFLDEVDKYPAFSGRDADPISLARARARTYLHRKRIVIGSTPTTREGAIYKAYQDCGDRRRYHVPCTHCHEYQALDFQQVKFNHDDDDKIKRADHIEATQCSYYECVHCEQAITDQHKPAMLLRGVWLSEGQSIDIDGTVTGLRPKAKRVGFQISALYSPWVSFSAMAAQFIRSIGDVGMMMEFRNQWLAEVFEHLATTVKVSDLSADIETAPAPLVVPKWAAVLTATADVHGDGKGFYYGVRAWGNGYRSQLIHHGITHDLDELREQCLNRPYKLDGWDDYLMPVLMLIDSGYRTDEIYNFCGTDTRIRPVKGASTKPKQTISWGIVAKELGITLAILDTDYFKDRLLSLRHEGKWGINAAVGDIYLKHLAAEHKVIDRRTGAMSWELVSSSAANHYLDVEVYQCAAADVVGASVLPSEPELEAQRQHVQLMRQQAAEPQHKPNSMRMRPSKWLQTSNRWMG